MRCPACAFGKLRLAPGYWGGPMHYGCTWHGETFGTADTGCGWTGPKPPSIARRALRRLFR